MIVVYDLNGVFFTNGFSLGVRKIAEHLGKNHAHVESIFSTPHAKAYRSGVHDPETFWRSVSEHFAEVSIVKELLFSSYVPVEEARDFFQRLRKAGIRIGYLSNSPRDRSSYLEQKHGFKRHFDIGISSFEVGAKKPEQRIYEELIARSGVPASDIVFVDDKEENLIPACALGMKTALFTHFSQLENDLKQMGLKF